MKKLEFENQVAKIYSNDEAGYVFIEWLSPTLHAEFADAYERVLKLAAEKNLKNWISDMRRLGALSNESITYTNKILIPMIQHLGKRKSALIVSGDTFDKMVLDDMMEKIDVQYQTRHFSNLKEAEAWMNQPITTNH